MCIQFGLNLEDIHIFILIRGRPAQQFDDNQQTEDDEVEEYSTEEDGTVVTQLSHRVQDGTRCRPGSLDMCIHGKCQVS